MQLNIMQNLKTFIASSKRVFVIAKKPDWNEFQTMAKVTGIGILVIAAIAYIVFLIFALSGIG